MDAPDWVRYLPTLNASLNGLATVLLCVGFAFIINGKVQAHKRTMLSAFAVSVVFLASYLLYHSYHLTKQFPGTGPSRTIYLTILATHVVLAALVPFLAIATIWRGFRAERETDPMQAIERWAKHRRLAKITFPIWLYVSVTGVIIYVMLYHWAPAA